MLALPNPRWILDFVHDQMLSPGPAMQNGPVESFDGRMRDELPNGTLFLNLDYLRRKIAAWVERYHRRQPHSALGYQTPADFAAKWWKQ